MNNFEKYLEQNKMWSFEGQSGIRKFERLVTEVCGYGKDRIFNDVLREFLEDNPGAIDVMVEWIRDYTDYPHHEWAINLDALVGVEEDVEEELE